MSSITAAAAADLFRSEPQGLLDVGEGEAASFPDARLTVVPGAGLFSHEERSAEVAAALLPVLAGGAP